MIVIIITYDLNLKKEACVIICSWNDFYRPFEPSLTPTGHLSVNGTGMCARYL